MINHQPFDLGLQAERTLLAWQRTVLDVGVGCAIAVRYTAPHFGASAVICGFIGLSAATAAYFGARYRYRRMHRALQQAATLVTVSAWPLAVLAASTLVFGGLAFVFLATR